MAVPFSPRAALCTAIVVAGFATAVTAQLPGGLFGLIGMDREGLLTIETGGTPREEDGSDIVTAVLTHEARNTARGAVCVRLADEGEALASERAQISQMQRAAADAPAATRARLIAELDRRRNPTRAWSRPPASGADAVAPLGEENVRQLRSAEAALLGGPGAARVDITLDMSGLPESLQSNARDCPVLAFTAPAVAGDIAFVEIQFTPPGRPEESWLYAVAKLDGHWSVEGVVRP